jgi:hypothetical protein
MAEIAYDKPEPVLHLLGSVGVLKESVEAKGRERHRLEAYQRPEESLLIFPHPLEQA